MTPSVLWLAVCDKSGNHHTDRPHDIGARSHRSRRHFPSLESGVRGEWPADSVQCTVHYSAVPPSLWHKHTSLFTHSLLSLSLSPEDRKLYQREEGREGREGSCRSRNDTRPAPARPRDARGEYCEAGGNNYENRKIWSETMAENNFYLPSFCQNIHLFSILPLSSGQCCRCRSCRTDSFKDWQTGKWSNCKVL